MDKQILIIGCGEIGSAIREIEIDNGNNVSVIDEEATAKPGEYDVIHICFPYSEVFEGYCKAYMKEFSAPIRVIHSTVKLGVTERLEGFVHSPVCGKHPHLKDSILKYTKFVGGDEELSKKAIEHLKEIGIHAEYLGSSRTTEAAKMLSTSYYGWNIAFATMVQNYCNENWLDFSKVYTKWNKSHNKDVAEKYKRPILEPCLEGLGGHCVYENAVLLDYADISKEIIKLGKELQ